MKARLAIAVLATAAGTALGLLTAQPALAVPEVGWKCAVGNRHCTTGNTESCSVSCTPYQGCSCEQGPT